MKKKIIFATLLILILNVIFLVVEYLVGFDVAVSTFLIAIVVLIVTKE